MSRDYVFTAWEEPNIDNDKCRYWVYGKELCPTTNREHYQGLIVFNRTCRIPGAKRIMGGGADIHLEPRRGTREQADKYARKDGDVKSWGRLEAFSQNELFRQPTSYLIKEHPAFYCRYHKGLEMLKSYDVPKWRGKVETIIIWGPPGSGKTRHVMEQDDVYKIDSPYKWWDGYRGESILLIDDYTEGMIDRAMLLNICDGWKQRLETKGGHTWALWKKVYITSNSNPALWACGPMERRVTEIIHKEL